MVLALKLTYIRMKQKNPEINSFSSLSPSLLPFSFLFCYTQLCSSLSPVLRVYFWELRGTYGVLDIKPILDMCKALPVVLLLKPHG